MTTSPFDNNNVVSDRLRVLEQSKVKAQRLMDRFKAEIQFCLSLAVVRTNQNDEWMTLIAQAIADVNAAVAGGGDVAGAVSQAEELLEPIGKEARQYTIHCVGHGHIDMNWMWNWTETVAVTNDTFTTVDRLMDEYPDFHYSQSQASVYQIAKDYHPALYDRIKQRIADRRWEVTANHWVEGDKNLASGEILCRHILYTKRLTHQEFGLPYDAVSIDWEPDTFGHAHTVPTILNKAGIKRYYLHRAGPGPMLFWWQGKDGSRVLTFDDRLRGYNGQINENIVQHLIAFEQATGLKDFLFVFGVGDHGGGPTRRDLNAALEMSTWKLFPRIKLSTTDAFFSIAEAQATNLPVVDEELNYVFEGCYTAQSNIKRANRKSENALFASEAYALLARGLNGLDYPTDDFAVAWRYAMFNQFHDILPGSGIHATYEHAQGLFQEIMTRASMVKTRSLRAIAAQIDTVTTAQSKPYQLANDIGGGPGDIPADGSLSRLGAGGRGSDPFVIFNPCAWKRSDVVTMRLWDREYADGEISVSDPNGTLSPAQVIERGSYWGHRYIGIAMPTTDVPAMGYSTYHVVNTATMPSPELNGATGDGKGTIENEFLRVRVDQASGAVVSLIDKATGVELVPAGQQIGLLEYYLEAPHPMTAWVMGQIKEYRPFIEGGVIDCPHKGPHVAAVRARHALNDSTFTTTISLSAGVPRLDFTLEVNWLERGAADIGVPMLRVAFPLAIQDSVATYECPNGHVTRSTDTGELQSYTSWLGGSYWSTAEAVDTSPGDVPAQKWADLSGIHTGYAGPVGATVLNDTKYGYNAQGSTLRLTLLRSSYDPDPLPELGNHTIRFAIQPHTHAWSPAHATRAGYEFNLPFDVVGTDEHAGDLPLRRGFAEILTNNVMISGMKKHEDSDALVVRIYEMHGQPTTAMLRLDDALCKADAQAVEVDLVEQPLSTNTAKVVNGILHVDVPAFGMVTVRIG